MYIREVSKSEKQLLDEIVSIHLAAFSGFFLTFMGRGFLRQMYGAYCGHPDSALLAAVRGGRAVGFLAYSEDLSGLYRFMLKRGLIPFAWYSLGALLRRPGIFLRLVRALLKPGEARREEPYAALTSIGVKPEMKSTGIGSQLLDELKARVDFSRCAYIALETDAENNSAANSFYQKNGFVRHRRYTTPEGRRMIEYRYRKEAVHEGPGL